MAMLTDNTTPDSSADTATAALIGASNPTSDTVAQGYLSSNDPMASGITMPQSVPQTTPQQDATNLGASVAAANQSYSNIDPITGNQLPNAYNDPASLQASAQQYFSNVPSDAKPWDTKDYTPPGGPSIYRTDDQAKALANMPNLPYSPDNEFAISDPRSPLYGRRMDGPDANSSGTLDSSGNRLPSGATPNPGDGINKNLRGMQTYVPGLGMIGPDLKGAVQGDMLRQQQLRANNQDFRQEAQLGLAAQAQQNQNDYVKIAQQKLGIDLADLHNRQIEFGWKTQDRNRQQAIIQGMSQAAQTGGYGGAIDFLRVADPVMAVGLEAQKQKLDAGIMQNQVAQAWLPSQQANGMLASYATLGRMYQGIMNAPADQQNNLYQAALPMIQKVNPQAPSDWGTQAQAEGMLSVAQAMPQNVLWNTAAQQAFYNDAVVKNNAALSIAMSKYGADSPLVQQLQQENQALQAKNIQAGLDNTMAASKIGKQNMDTLTKQTDTTETFNKNLSAASQNYTAFLNNLKVMQPLVQTIQKDPGSPQALVAGNGLLINFAKMWQDKRINPALLDSALTDNHLQNWYKSIQSEIGNGKISITPENLSGLTNVIDTLGNSMQNAQTTLENQYKKSIPSYTLKQSDGSTIQAIIPGAIRYPSEQYHQILNYNSNNSQQLTPQQQQAVNSAIQRGVSQSQIQQVIGQFQGKSNGGQ